MDAAARSKDTEIHRLRNSADTKHSTHAESALRFIFLDLNATKTKDELIADRQLQRELRKKLFKRKEDSYQYLTNFAKHYS
jgi:hypothetical protein